MKAHSCAELAELRSAYVDGALDDADRERLLTHLVDCTDCRRDVAELRHVRALLTGSTDPGLTPVDLSHRLVSIAGDEATEPLWTRPFRRTPAAGQLPSQRHQVRIRVLAGVLGCGLAVLTGARHRVRQRAVGQRAHRPRPDQPGDHRVHRRGVCLPAGRAGQCRPPGSAADRLDRRWLPTGVSLPAKALSEAKAVKLLTQAGQAGDQLPYTATQVVDLQRDDERIRNTVQVSSSGAGTRLSPGGSGTATVSTHSYVETDSSTRMADADLIERLAHRYTLRGWKSQSYADRTAYVVEAVEPTATPADGDLSGVAARWWIDSRSKLLFGQETYDGRGNLVISSWLTDLRFGAAADVNGPDSRTGPAGQPPRTTATLTLSRAGQLRRNGWICAERLAGLPLLRLRTDQTGDPDLVHLVYSDGLTTVSVVEQRGRLHGAPTGTTRNETLGAWVTEQMPATATWTSGDIVLTAVTDGSRETLAAAVAALPHDGRQRPTTMERVRAGWSRILGR